MHYVLVTVFVGSVNEPYGLYRKFGFRVVVRVSDRQSHIKEIVSVVQLVFQYCLKNCKFIIGENPTDVFGSPTGCKAFPLTRPPALHVCAHRGSFNAASQIGRRLRQDRF